MKIKSCFIYIISVSAIISSCGYSKNNKEDVQEIKYSIGEYLYLSNDNILHTDNNCIHFLFSDNNALGVKYIDTLKIKSDRGYYYCTKCFNQDLYKHVQKIINNNSGWSLKEIIKQ